MNIEWLLIGVLGVLAVVWLIGRRCVAKARKDRIVGWARVSLLGRVEYVGAVCEVERNGDTWLELLTADGRTMRTQPGAVYSIERLPFGMVEDEVVQAVDERNRDAKTLRDQRDHARDAVDARDARIDNLRDALERVRHGLAELNVGPGPTVNVILQQINEALETDAAEDCPF